MNGIPDVEWNMLVNKENVKDVSRRQELFEQFVLDKLYEIIEEINCLKSEDR